MRSPCRPSRIQVRHSLNIELTEIDLSVSAQRKQQVYDLIIKQGLKNSQPAKIYKAVFMNFIEKITDFTLGDWREIVKLAEPTEPVLTKKAWKLYTEALIRHKNRIAALGFMEKRKLKNQTGVNAPGAFTDKPGQMVALPIPPPERQTLKTLPSPQNLGNPYFQKKYAKEWEKSLALCSGTTADFLNRNAGLFHVEVTAKVAMISIEITNIPNLKSKLKDLYKETEIQLSFSKGFGKEAKVMLRLAQL